MLNKGTVLPGIQIRPIFTPRDDAVTPVTKNTGRTAISSAVLPYKTYIGYNGCRDKDWLNDLDTDTAFVDRAGNSINGITINETRVDIGQNSENTVYEQSISISATAMELGTTYKAFVGTRKYENVGEFMMFNWDINDTTGNHNRGESKFTSSFSDAEQVALNGAWIICWNMPNVTNIYTGNSTHTDFGALAEGTNGIMKSYYDVESYNEPRPQEFAHFSLSEDVKLTNGRIVKFLKIANNRVYFQILEPYDLDTAAGRSIGTP